jgi:hypothetical protein
MRAKNSPLFEIARALVRLDHVASVIVNVDHGIMRPAVKLLFCVIVFGKSFCLANRSVKFGGDL